MTNGTQHKFGACSQYGAGTCSNNYTTSTCTNTTRTIGATFVTDAQTMSAAIADGTNYLADNADTPVNGGWPVLLWENTWLIYTINSVNGGEPLTAGGTVSTVEITNYIPESGVVIVALYDGDRFVSVSTEAVSGSGTVTLANPISLPDDISDCEVKVFIWNDLNTLMPLASEFSL